MFLLATVAAKNNTLCADWRKCIGENIIDITVARFSKTLAANQSDALVLGVIFIFIIR